MPSPPTSTHVMESIVIAAPLSKVWHMIKLGNFASFWSALESSSPAQDNQHETDVAQWNFKDGTHLTIKQEAHSCNLSPSPSSILPFSTDGWKRTAIDHSITYSAIASEPPMSYSSVVSTIRCLKVTSGTGGTFVQWSADFSNDADAGVVEDARFKRREALADLEKVVLKNL